MLCSKTMPAAWLAWGTNMWISPLWFWALHLVLIFFSIADGSILCIWVEHVSCKLDKQSTIIRKNHIKACKTQTHTVHKQTHTVKELDVHKIVPCNIWILSSIKSLICLYSLMKEQDCQLTGKWIHLAKSIDNTDNRLLMWVFYYPCQEYTLLA